MTILLIVALAEVPVVAAVSLYLVHLLLRGHNEILAAVIGRKAQDLRKALADAEDRVTRAARGGVVSRAGPARLKD